MHSNAQYDDALALGIVGKICVVSASNSQRVLLSCEHTQKGRESEEWREGMREGMREGERGRRLGRSKSEGEQGRA